MMSKDEVNEIYNKLEADLKILEQIMEQKDRILELIDEGTDEEREKVQTEYDALEDQLQIVELFW